MENKFYSSMNVEELRGVIPVTPHYGATELKLAIIMNKYQITSLIFEVLEFFTVEELNEILSLDGITIIDNNK